MANDRSEQIQGLEMNHVVELQKILLTVNKLREEQQINMLVEQMQKMANNYTAVLQDISNCKEKLNSLSPLKKMKYATSHK